MKNNTDTQTFDYSADAQLVVSNIEDIHPIFSLNEVPVTYEKAKAEYIKYTGRQLSITEFRLATLKFLAVLGDGHVSRSLAFYHGASLYIDVEWVANDSKLYLLDKDKQVTNIEVVMIGGVSSNKIAEQVDIHYAAENAASRQHNYVIFCRQQDMFKMAGCNYGYDSIELTLSDGKVIVCKFTPFHDGLRHELNFRANYIIKHELINDVFYINLRSLKKDKSIDDTAEEIKKAIDRGTKKFIIDVRDNSGGNSTVGIQLLQAMGMYVPNYGMYVRHSKLAQQTLGYKTDDESFTLKSDVNGAVPNENIDLLILTNINTFSSANMLGVYVQDGKLGKIVGQISSNKPNHYGEMLSVLLPDSKIIFNISCKKFLRPDINANPNSLIPDIEVPFGGDILAVALDYMASVK